MGLGRALYDGIRNLDRCDPEIKALIERAKGTFWGDLVAGRFAPSSTIGKPKPVRGKKLSPGRKGPKLASLFDE